MNTDNTEIKIDSIVPQNTVLRGYGNRKDVWEMKKLKTTGNLTRNDLMMSKKGLIISKKKHELGKANSARLASYSQTRKERASQRKKEKEEEKNYLRSENPSPIILSSENEKNGEKKKNRKKRKAPEHKNSEIIEEEEGEVPYPSPIPLKKQKRVDVYGKEAKESSDIEMRNYDDLNEEEKRMISSAVQRELQGESDFNFKFRSEEEKIPETPSGAPPNFSGPVPFLYKRNF